VSGWRSRRLTSHQIWRNKDVLSGIPIDVMKL